MRDCKIILTIATSLIFSLLPHIGFSQMGEDVSILIQNLKDEDLVTRSRAAYSLGDLKDPRAVEPLIAVLKEKDSSLHWPAVQALVKIGTPAVDPLIVALKDEYPEVRKNAARILGEIKDPRAVEPLIATLKDRDSRVRSMVVYALGCIKDARTVEPLVAVVLKDEDQHIRTYVGIKALQKIKDPQIVKLLLAALKDDDPRVRRNAAQALKQIKDLSAVEPLIAALKDRDPEVRKNAAWAFVNLKDPRAAEPLIATLKDKDPEVRKNAAWALENLKDPRAVEALVAALRDKDSKVRWRAGISLRHMGTAGIEALIAALKDKDPTVRMSAGLGLTYAEPKKKKDRHAIYKALIAAVKDKDLAVVAGAHFYYLEKCLPKFLKRGVPGVETMLIESLNQYGAEGMAENFLNHGNRRLKKAAREWADTHGYRVSYLTWPYSFYILVSKEEK